MKESYTSKEFQAMFGKSGKILKPETFDEAVKPNNILDFDPHSYIFIPGEVYSSKNSTQIRVKLVKWSKWKVLMKGSWRFVQPFIAKSDAAKGYQDEKAHIYRKFTKQFREMSHGKEFPLFVEIIFVRKTLRFWDWINMVQIVQDCMVDARWLPDDNVNIMFPTVPMKQKKQYLYGKDNPGVYIKVL